MWSRTTERAGVVVLLAALSACGPDVRTIDLCGRGDRADLAAALSGGELELSVLDDGGATIVRATLPASGARVDLEVEGGARLQVVGRDRDGSLRAEGEVALGEGEVCVCLALAGQSGACAGITCRVEADRCAFFDAATGEPAATRALDLAVADTMLVSAEPDKAHGADATVRAAVDAAIGLLRFDTGVLPRTSVIEEAALELTLVPPPATPPGIPVRVVPVLEAWDEAAATWRERASGVPWASPGCGDGSCAREPWAVFDPDRAAERYRVPLGQRIAPWVSGERANHGLALVGTGSETALWSREGQGAGAAPPRLIVRYHMIDDDLPPPPDGPICGNGLVEPGEACDDGDRDDTDACTNACAPARCGDGITRAGVEDCDDGNGRNDDGCSLRCLRCADANADATFTGADGRCYARFDTPRIYGVAENSCDEAGHGTLAVFESRAEADTVLAALGDGAPRRWIGLSDRTSEGTFAWVTGEVPAYDAFGPGEPATPPAAGTEDCVTVSAGAWADRGCGEAHGYLCERAGWAVDPDGRAWLPVLGPTIDWEAARLECVALGAHLAVLATVDDNTRVSGLAAVPVWIGLSEHGAEGRLVWVTGQPLGAAMFESPPVLDGDTFCTELDEGGTWSVATCAARRHYVCEAE
jgi:cysteine-rich repeat protein